MPSEAEWEYACRAGTMALTTLERALLIDLANYRQQPGPLDVGSFPPNAFGLYDLHGNVWEWCLDHWHRNYEGAPTDGSAWVKGGIAERRVLRGGSWDDTPGYCRSAARAFNIPDFRNQLLGFRVACSAP